MDTSAFGALRSPGGAGAAGYDPDMLVTVLVWAYAQRRDLLAAGRGAVPHRRGVPGDLRREPARPLTFARFRADFPEVIAVFFAAVLGLCAELGMGKLGVVALDGTKIAASASKSANRTEDTLRKMAAETVARARRRRRRRGRDVRAGTPRRRGAEDAWSPRRRDERIAAVLAGLEAGREAAEAEQEQQAARATWTRSGPGTGRAARPPPPTLRRRGCGWSRPPPPSRPRSGTGNARQAAKTAATGTGLRAHRPAPVSDHFAVRRAAAAVDKALARAAAAARPRHDGQPAAVRNITDPDSRLMPVRGGGFIQGYNAQNWSPPKTG